jgi:hypothetical protein
MRDFKFPNLFSELLHCLFLFAVPLKYGGLIIFRTGSIKNNILIEEAPFNRQGKP